MNEGLPDPDRPRHWAGIRRVTFASSGIAAVWAVLILLSTAIAGLLGWLGVPAALLLGPMIGGIIVASRGAMVPIPAISTALAQGLLGCLVAKNLPISISADLLERWPLYIAGISTVILASGGLGWVLTRMRLLPGTTVVWGLSPGAASIMTLMSEAYGADSRLVAFMQYVRVIIVAAIASVVAKLTGTIPSEIHGAAWFPPVLWPDLLGTLALAAGGPYLAHRFKLRAGGFIIPLAVGVLLARLDWMEIELPRWLLTLAYAFLGWRIGLRFTKPLLLHALRLLPGVVGCSLVLVAVCGGLAAVFVVFAGMDPLTAYLATSPGGVDSVAIIAASSHADAPFVMTMQMARFFVVLISGPAMARFIAMRAGAASPPDGPPREKPT